MNTKTDLTMGRFCFYTGPEGAPEMQRSHSASSVEEYLSSTPHGTPREQTEFWASAHGHIQRSGSYDSIVTISGSTTPRSP
jgi:hypothetical protein